MTVQTRDARAIAVALMMDKIANITKLAKPQKGVAGVAASGMEEAWKLIKNFLSPEDLARVTHTTMGLNVGERNNFLKQLADRLVDYSGKGAKGAKGGKVPGSVLGLPEVNTGPLQEGATGGAAVGGVAGGLLDDGSTDQDTPMGTVHHDGGLMGRVKGVAKGMAAGSAIGAAHRLPESLKFKGGVEEAASKAGLLPKEFVDSISKSPNKTLSILQEAYKKLPAERLREVGAQQLAATKGDSFGSAAIGRVKDQAKQEITQHGYDVAPDVNAGMLEQLMYKIKDKAGPVRDTLSRAFGIGGKSERGNIDDILTAFGKNDLLGKGLLEKRRALAAMYKSGPFKDLKDPNEAAGISSALEDLLAKRVAGNGPAGGVPLQMGAGGLAGMSLMHGAMGDPLGFLGYGAGAAAASLPTLFNRGNTIPNLQKAIKNSPHLLGPDSVETLLGVKVPIADQGAVSAKVRQIADSPDLDNPGLHTLAKKMRLPVMPQLG